uniref:Uncharacterized protein n=1 Tax=Arundo donax TaxID=35708 RepID=A0A0A8Y5A3_ARUDO
MFSMLIQHGPVVEAHVGRFDPPPQLKLTFR